MKYPLRLITVLLSALCTTLLVHGSVWNDAYYDTYNYTNYTSFSAFNQSISETGYDADLMEAAIFYETNRQRSQYGLAQFKYDYALRVCAHNHSVDMVNHNFFSHTSVVSGKTSMGDRLAEVGYTNCAAAENIAYCSLKSTYAQTAAYLVAEMWMNSDGHRRNILNPTYNYLGCGAAFYEKDGFIYVKSTQNFLKK